MVHDSKDHCSKHNCLQESRQQEKERFLSFSLSKKKSIVDYFVLPFLHESHQNLCHSTVVEQ